MMKVKLVERKNITKGESVILMTILKNGDIGCFLNRNDYQKNPFVALS